MEIFIMNKYIKCMVVVPFLIISTVDAAAERPIDGKVAGRRDAIFSFWKLNPMTRSEISFFDSKLSVMEEPWNKEVKRRLLKDTPLSSDVCGVVVDYTELSPDIFYDNSRLIGCLPRGVRQINGLRVVDFRRDNPSLTCNVVRGGTVVVFLNENSNPKSVLAEVEERSGQKVNLVIHAGFDLSERPSWFWPISSGGRRVSVVHMAQRTKRE